MWNQWCEVLVRFTVIQIKYAACFTQYHTINFPASRQVRYYYANATALQAAKDG